MKTAKRYILIEVFVLVLLALAVLCATYIYPVPYSLQYRFRTGSIFDSAFIGALLSLGILIEVLLNRSAQSDKLRFSHLSSIFACASVFCFVAFSPSWFYPAWHASVFFLPVDGLVLAILAVVAGVIAMRKNESRIYRWGIYVGAIVIGLSCILLPATKGMPFLCADSDACYLFHDGASCDSTVGVGVCVSLTPTVIGLPAPIDRAQPPLPWRPDSYPLR